VVAVRPAAARFLVTRSTNSALKRPPFSAVFRREASPIVCFQRVALGEGRKFCGAVTQREIRRLEVAGEPRLGAEMGFRRGQFGFGFPWILSREINFFSYLRGLRAPKYIHRSPVYPNRSRKMRAEPVALKILAPAGLPHPTMLH
jgi:hypothetical protein